MGDKKKKPNVVQNVVEPIGEAVKKEGGEVVKSALDQVGLANWLYGSEKKLDKKKLQQVEGSEEAEKNEQLNKIRAELGENAQKTPTGEQKTAAIQQKTGFGQNEAKPGELSPEAQKMQIEHHREAEMLGVTQPRREEQEKQQQQELQTKEEVEKKKKKQEELQDLEIPQGKQTGMMFGGKRKKSSTKMRGKPKATEEKEKDIKSAEMKKGVGG